PTWYFFAVFGKPDKTGKWGFRIEGHHLSLNFTLSDGKLISSTPFFLGANPAVVKGGKRKGLQTLPEAEKPFRDLLALLTADQKKSAQQPKSFKEIDEAVAKPSFRDAVGLPVEKMNEKQKAALWKLIEGYAKRMPDEASTFELAEIKKAGVDKVHFAYGGGD